MINIEQRGAVGAYFVFEDIYKQKMKPSIAFQIFHLRHLLKKQYDFQIEREKQIIQDYKGEVKPDGSVSFPDQATINQVQSELDELAKSIVAIAAEPIDLMKEDILISPENIEKIRPFIIL